MKYKYNDIQMIEETMRLKMDNIHKNIENQLNDYCGHQDHLMRVNDKQYKNNINYKTIKLIMNICIVMIILFIVFHACIFSQRYISLPMTSFYRDLNTDDNKDIIQKRVAGTYTLLAGIIMSIILWMR